jgi:hypothetical protein
MQMVVRRLLQLSLFGLLCSAVVSELVQASNPAITWTPVGSCRSTGVVSERNVVATKVLSGIAIHRGRGGEQEKDLFRLDFRTIVPSGMPRIPISSRERILHASLEYQDTGTAGAYLAGSELESFKPLESHVNLPQVFSGLTNIGSLPDLSTGASLSSFLAVFKLQSDTPAFVDLTQAGGIDSSGMGTVTCSGAQ